MISLSRDVTLLPLSRDKSVDIYLPALSFILPSFSSFDPENKSAVMSNEAAKNAIILPLSIDANVGLI